MKAAMLHSFDAPPRVEEVAEPKVGDDHVLVHVHAAAAHPLIRAIAGGRHYASPKQFPVILGVDGVGHLESGQRVYFGPLRPPYGAMAERVAVPRALCTPIDAAITDNLAASLVNPGLAALLPLTWRAKLLAGESVCILGATGAAGQLAVRLAKLLGARRIVAVGRQASVLQQLRQVGATATLALSDTADLTEAFLDAAEKEGFDVILDYLWGAPAQALVDSIARGKFAKEIRWVQVGEMAGPEVRVSGAVLRSTGLTFSGFGLRATGMAPRDVEVAAIQQLMQYAQTHALAVDSRSVAPADLEAAWGRPGPRPVVCFV